MAWGIRANYRLLTLAGVGEHAQPAAGLLELEQLDVAEAEEGAAEDVHQRVLGYRIACWLDENSAALEKLRQLAVDNPRDGVVQLQLAQALATPPDGNSAAIQDIAESTRIARRVIATSAPASELNLTARWLWIKNQLRTGERDQARQAARLLLASQPLESEIWTHRLESVAE